MKDASDPIDDLDPLDPGSVDLLVMYRDVSGPSEDAEARMLAGLRARLGRERHADDPATAVAAKAAAAPREQNTASNARTFTIAAIAFAAGVALTVSLRPPSDAQDSSSATSSDAEQVVRRDAAGLPRPTSPETYVPPGASATHELSVPGTIGPASERPWPLSFADLAKPRELQPAPQEVDPAEGPEPLVLQPTHPDEPDDGTSHSPRRNAAGARHGTDGTEGATASRSPRRGVSDPSAAGRGTATPGAWAPSISGAPAGAGIGSAARNPSVAGASPTAPGSGSSNAGADSPPDKASSEPPPADEPPPPDEPEPEDEQPLDELCAEELDACLVDAETFCGSGYPDCYSVQEFCFMRDAMCLGEDGGVPYPHDPSEYPPDEPEPDECEEEYNMCMLGADACMQEQVVSEECDEIFWYCEDIIAACYGEPPPEPWW